MGSSEIAEVFPPISQALAGQIKGTIQDVADLAFGSEGSPEHWSAVGYPSLHALGYRVVDVAPECGAGAEQSCLHLVIKTMTSSKRRTPIDGGSADPSHTQPKDAYGKRHWRIDLEALSVALDHWPRSLATGRFFTLNPKDSNLRASEWCVDICEMVYRASLRKFSKDKGLTEEPAPSTRAQFRRRIQRCEISMPCFSRCKFEFACV